MRVCIITISTTYLYRWQMKKHSEVMQTLHAGCSKAEPNIFAQQTPSWQPKFNQLEMVITFTYRPSLVRSMHAISSYCGNRPTNINRQGRLQYTAPQLSAQCKQYIRKQYMPHTHYMTVEWTENRLVTSWWYAHCPMPQQLHYCAANITQLNELI